MYGKRLSVVVCVVLGLIWGSGCASSQGTAPFAKKSVGKREIILVGHGTPATDYPKDRLGEFFKLSLVHHQHGEHEEHGDHGAHHGHAHGHAAHGGAADADAGAARYTELEEDIRNWPRTPANDDYKAAVDALARGLEQEAGVPVRVAFNEFCAPSVPEAIDAAVAGGADEIVLLTMMMTRGGGHSEEEIPNLVKVAQKKYRGVRIVYAWPYDDALLVSTLQRQVAAMDVRR